MTIPLKGFNFDDFWEDSDYARKEYVDEAVTDELVASIEKELGYKLPSSYITLMKHQNGGIPCNTNYPTTEQTSWAGDHVAISGIMGIGRKKTYSLCGWLGSKFMQSEWGYPEIGICICNCPSAGHDMIMLDYRKNGKMGEPEVVHVDQEWDYKVTFLAKNFETFVRGLVNDSVYDTSKEDLARDLKNIETGAFSSLLATLVGRSKIPEVGKLLRSLCRKLTNEKGYFALHADPLSYLVYDLQFLLYSSARKVKDKDTYFESYPKMLALSDGEFSTGGYAHEFVKDWMNDRIRKRNIVKGEKGTLVFTSKHIDQILHQLHELA